LAVRSRALVDENQQKVARKRKLSNAFLHTQVEEKGSGNRGWSMISARKGVHSTQFHQSQ